MEVNVDFPVSLRLQQRDDGLRTRAMRCCARSRQRSILGSAIASVRADCKRLRRASDVPEADSQAAVAMRAAQSRSWKNHRLDCFVRRRQIDAHVACRSAPSAIVRLLGMRPTSPAIA